MGWGSTILGHADDRIQAAIRAVLDSGGVLPFPHPIEMEVSRMLPDEFPSNDMVVFREERLGHMHDCITARTRVDEKKNHSFLRFSWLARFRARLLPLRGLRYSGPAGALPSQIPL
jgi:hypothetical protein